MARTVLTLLTKSCTSNSFCTSPLLTIPSTEKCLKKQSRHLSQSANIKKTPQERTFFWRSTPKNTDTFEEIETQEEQIEEQEVENDPIVSVNTFPPVTDLRIRDSAKAFIPIQKYEEEEIEEDEPLAYEIDDGFFRERERLRRDYMKKMEKNRRMFLHLQPCNLQSFGSKYDQWHSELEKTKFNVVYPRASTAFSDLGRRKRVEEFYSREFSSFNQLQNNDSSYESDRIADGKKSLAQNLNRRSYSNIPVKDVSENLTVERKPAKLTISTRRKSSTASIKTRKQTTKERRKNVETRNE